MLNKPKILFYVYVYFTLYQQKKVRLDKTCESKKPNWTRFEGNNKHKIKLIKYLDFAVTVKSLYKNGKNIKTP